MSESVGVVPLFDVTLIFCDEPENVTVEPSGASFGVWEKPAVIADRIKSPERVMFLVLRLRVALPVISRSQSNDRLAPARKVIADELLPTFTNDPAPDTVQSPEVVGVALLCTL